VKTAANGSLIVREIGAEIVILDTRSSQIHRLNATASQIWKSLQDGMDSNEIARLVEGTFDVPHSVALTDVNSVVMKLRTLFSVAC